MFVREDQLLPFKTKVKNDSQVTCNKTNYTLETLFKSLLTVKVKLKDTKGSPIVPGCICDCV